MTELLSGLMSQFGGDSISQLAKSIGSDEKSTESALGSAMPILLSALAKNSASPQGALSLNNALEKDHDGSVLNDLSGFLGGGKAESIGGGILGHLLGSKSVAVENQVAKESGLSSDAVASLLKMAAPVVLGYIGKQKNENGGGIDSLTQILSSVLSGSNVSGSQSMIEQLLDKDKDGDIMDDVADMGKSLLGGMFK